MFVYLKLAKQLAAVDAECEILTKKCKKLEELNSEMTERELNSRATRESDMAREFSTRFDEVQFLF